MQEGSLFSTPSPAFVICRFSDDGHSDRCEVIPHCRNCELYYSQFPREGGTPHRAGPHREVPGLVRRQKEWGENMAYSLLGGFHGKEWVGQGRQVWASLGLGSLNNPSGPWAIEVVFSRLVLGRGVVWGRGNTDLIHGNCIKEVFRDMDFRLVGVMDWMFVSPQNSYVEVPVPSVTVFGGEDLGK